MKGELIIIALNIVISIKTKLCLAESAKLQLFFVEESVIIQSKHSLSTEKFDLLTWWLSAWNVSLLQQYFNWNWKNSEVLTIYPWSFQSISNDCFSCNLCALVLLWNKFLKFIFFQFMSQTWTFLNFNPAILVAKNSWKDERPHWMHYTFYNVKMSCLNC